jgi:glutamate synthase (NADPH/NADH) small chain
VNTKRFVDDGNGNVRALKLVSVEMKNVEGRVTFEEVAGSEQELPCDLALLAMGFLGPEKPGMLEQLGLELDGRGNVISDKLTWMTSVEGIFSAGDMQRGQSLIVWAIAEGRSAARGVDEYLMGNSDLPAPV